jgi:rRNA maturation endonuclease Nob1
MLREGKYIGYCLVCQMIIMEQDKMSCPRCGSKKIKETSEAPVYLDKNGYK